MKYIILIISIVIICAYIFGVVFISVFKSKINEIISSNNNSIEKFTSQEEEEEQSQIQSQIQEEEKVYKSQLKQILYEEEEDSKMEAEEEMEEKTEEEEEKEKVYKRKVKKDLKKYITKREIEPKNIKLNQNDSQEVIYNTNINQEKDLTLPENNDYIIVKKKYLIEKFKENTSIDGNDGDFKGMSVWNFDYEKHDAIKNVCFKNHEHKKCSYGNTNYADPRTMSIIEKRTFTLSYPPNMTMQDYINWLYSFIGKEDQLPYNHLKNLEKLKRGIPLIQENGVCPPPSSTFPPLDAETYFKNMYDVKSNEIAFAPQLNSTTSVLVGSNYNQYSEFSQNFDVYGSSGEIRNPDIAYKMNAKKLDNIIIPKDSNDLELEQKFKPFFVKNIEV
jgi:hypothetical protein